MKHFLFLAALLPQLLFAQTPAENPLDLLRPGTVVLLETAAPINSTDFAKGDSVPLRTVNALAVNGQTLIEKGAAAKGFVREIRAATATAPAAIRLESVEFQAFNGVWVQLEKGLEEFEGFVTGEDFMEIPAGSLLRAKVAEQIFPAAGNAQPETQTAENTEHEAALPDRYLADPMPNAWAETEPTDSLETIEPADDEPTNQPTNPLADVELALEIEDEAVPAQLKIGDPVRLRVSDDVATDDGQVLFRERAAAWGKVKHLTQGSIYVVATEAITADGQRVALEGRSLRIEFDPEEADELLPLEGELTAIVVREAMVGR